MTERVAITINDVHGTADEFVVSGRHFEVKDWRQIGPTRWKAQMTDLLAELQVRHSTQYEGISDKSWEWRCECGLKETLPDWEACHRRTRTHWADLMLSWFEQVHLEARSLISQIEGFCPCGARPEALSSHPHVPGCPVERLVHVMGVR